jgi:4-hydroxy 2-oxovalerate aldolase
VSPNNEKIALSTPNILDVTVRDGSYLINHQFTPKMVEIIARDLHEAGIKFAEISHGCGIGSRLMGLPAQVDDEDLMEAAKIAAPDLKISAFISVSDISIAVLPGLVDFFDIGRVGVNINEIKSAEKIIKKLKKFNKTVSVQLVRTHARPPDFAAKTAKLAQELGADIVYVVDTFGSLLPQDVQEYVSAIIANTQVLVGFHGHNHIGMAIPNTMAAWEAGASWLDASLMGVGRDAGNANLEILATLIELAGSDLGINIYRLCETTKTAIHNIFGRPPYSKFVDLICSENEIDYSPSNILELSSQYLHLPLENFILQLKAKLGEQVSVSEGHFKAVFKDFGQDFDSFIIHLSEQK